MGVFTNKRFWFYARRALWILVAWVLIANVIFFYDFITLSSAGALDSNYDLKSEFLANMVVAVSAGIIGGLVTVNLMEYWLRKYAFWKALLLIVVIYVVTSILISGLGAAYSASMEFELPIWNHEVIEEAGFIYGRWLFWKNFVIWLFIVLVTLIILMINDKFGPGVFPDYLRGRYFLPKRERRIFMFADIKNATGIAEALGEAKYFNFLKDFFKDIGPAVVASRGEIYQYVGDEVVITWKTSTGIKNGNALGCYFHMKELIARKTERYQQRYGQIPEFKVGFHCGAVMVGELGQIKRDIAFSGDVLNTAARIQAKCNELDVAILSSAHFAEVAYQLPEGIRSKPLGMHPLKGKAEAVALVTFGYEN